MRFSSKINQKCFCFFQKRGRLSRITRAFGPIYLRGRRVCSLPDRPVNLDGLSPDPDELNPDPIDSKWRHQDWTVISLSFPPSRRVEPERPPSSCFYQLFL
jgi:hypothetical protein